MAAGGARPLELLRFDSKGNNEVALAMLKAALDRQVALVMQGNSSSTVAEWHPNVGIPASERFYASFRERFPKPQDDVSVMERVGSVGVPHHNEGSGSSFKTLRDLEPCQTEQPSTCKMDRP